MARQKAQEVQRDYLSKMELLLENFSCLLLVGDGDGIFPTGTFIVQQTLATRIEVGAFVSKTVAAALGGDGDMFRYPSRMATSSSRRTIRR
jgi:hypothetical protein